MSFPAYLQYSHFSNLPTEQMFEALNFPPNTVPRAELTLKTKQKNPTNPKTQQHKKIRNRSNTKRGTTEMEERLQIDAFYLHTAVPNRRLI